jgi:ribosomal protein L16 Arg81 hydroxylase
MSESGNATPSTLAELVSPLTETEFLDLLRRRQLTYRPGSRCDRFAPFVGWAALRNILASGNSAVRTDQIKVTKESLTINPKRWMADGKVDPAKLEKFVADGFSLVMLRVEEHVPALAALCTEIKTRLREGTFVGVIVTSGTGVGAFQVHFDPEDLLILQIEGTKRWQVFGPVVPNPLRAMPKQTLENPQPILDEVLEPGDLLFVPGGYWHHCESGLSTSVHLGIFFFPPAGWHAINEALQRLLSDELFRIPLSRLEGEADFARAEQEIKNRAIEKIKSLQLREFVARWHDVAY